jgi:ribosomal protein L9
MGAMKIELLEDVEDLGKAGSQPDVDDETANQLVSAGKARQLNPFVITEAHTQAPPMSSEKVAGEVERLKREADEADASGKDVQEAQGAEGARAAAATEAQAGERPKGTLTAEQAGQTAGRAGKARTREKE